MKKRTFTVWHKGIGAKKWVRKGRYANITAAAQVVFDGSAKTEGAWKAIPTGQAPDAPDDDDE